MYPIKRMGTVGADDDSFCSIGINVDSTDSGERRQYFMELVDNPKEYADKNPHMIDFKNHEPMRVRMHWEGNCCGDVGVWLSQGQARALALLLLQASQEKPMAHELPESRLTRKHMAHYNHCNCLGHASECCDPNCECHNYTKNGIVTEGEEND